MPCIGCGGGGDAGCPGQVIQEERERERAYGASVYVSFGAALRSRPVIDPALKLCGPVDAHAPASTYKHRFFFFFKDRIVM